MPGPRLRPRGTDTLRLAQSIDPATSLSHPSLGAIGCRSHTLKRNHGTSGDPMNWYGVMPAMTTPFNSDLTVDHAFLAQHAAWLLENGCTGLVMLGSLGEGATLEHDEKIAILKTAVKASEATKTPVVAAISALSTKHAVQLAQEAEAAGCSGLMVLPPYVYTSDWREMKHHVATVIAATKLPCMLYNNPVAYKTDFLPE